MGEADALAVVAEAMRQVRMAYDRYFMGLERLEPAKERDAAKKMLQRLMGETPRNTAYKFRLQTLQASWNTWEAHWNRIARQIEEGSFKRDKQKAAATKPVPSAAQAPGPNLSPPPPALGKAAAAATAPPSQAAAWLSEASVAHLHREFAAARQSLGLPPGGPSLAALGQTLSKQAQSIISQYKCQSVEFKVAIKDGKPILKATPR